MNSFPKKKNVDKVSVSNDKSKILR